MDFRVYKAYLVPHTCDLHPDFFDLVNFPTNVIRDGDDEKDP